MMVVELVVVLTAFRLVTLCVCGVEREMEAFWTWCDNE